jgi:hypothetical protein
MRAIIRRTLAASALPLAGACARGTTGSRPSTSSSRAVITEDELPTGGTESACEAVVRDRSSCGRGRRSRTSHAIRLAYTARRPHRSSSTNSTLAT